MANDGLTAKGYWALLRDAGIVKVGQLPGSINWLARNRHNLIFPVRDPDDLTPEQRQRIADDIIAVHG